MSTDQGRLETTRELEALTQIAKLLEPLDGKAIARILLWLATWQRDSIDVEYKAATDKIDEMYKAFKTGKTLNE